MIFINVYKNENKLKLNLIRHFRVAKRIVLTQIHTK